MKTIWLWIAIAGAALLGCTEPQSGGRRGLHSNDPVSQVGSDGGITCGSVVCDPHATCAGALGAQHCACLSGYEGDGRLCTDVDECARSLDDCDPNADCKNLPGRFTCACRTGFTGDGKTCTDVDECKNGTGTCDPNATCTNTPGSFSCTCNVGFAGDGFACSKAIGCATKCPSNERCDDTPSGYACECAPGFARSADGSCRALCDATSGPVCQGHGVCRVDGRTAVCDACSPGFSGDGVTCTQASCQAACDGVGTDDAADVVCNADGSCACAPGWSGSPGSCTDVNECATNNGSCGDNALCINVAGGHLCDCKPGYTLDGTGACVDVDECQHTPGPCPADATCTNKAPAQVSQGFVCTCNAGFIADAGGCKDIDECATNNGGCPAGSACVNTRGSFSCGCSAPLVGSPGSCHCDLSGIWAMRQDVDTCWGAVPVQAGSAQNLISPGFMEATIWELHEIQYDGQVFSAKKKGCGSDNTPDLISPVFRETYSAYVPNATFDKLRPIQGASFSAPLLVPGSTFVAPSEAAVLGIDLGSDPLHATWPAAWSDVSGSSWVDADGDGEPGLTLWPRLPSQLTDRQNAYYSYIPARPAIVGGSLVIDERAACVSVALRVITHVEGTLDSCDHITGQVVNESTEGRVHSCILANKGSPCDPSQPYTNPGQSPANCAGWGTDVTCNPADWTGTTGKCLPEDLDRLDNDQNQKQNSKATFELMRIGKLGDTTLTCDTVRNACFAPGDCGSIIRPAPTITCTSPQ